MIASGDETPPSAREQRVLPAEEFVAWLRSEGVSRYHDSHPFHLRLHAGSLSRQELQSWVLNRYYYQTRIPIKDALIVAKSEDPAFRRAWLRRIIDHDGAEEGQGGLALWERLGDAVGVPRAELVSARRVLPGVRFACDAYVTLVREGTLLEAVAASLTEFFAPELMTKRVEAFERHYPWLESSALDYFRQRVPKASRDSQEALAFVVQQATTAELQAGCVAALIQKTEILWHLLECVASATAGEA